MLQLVVRPKENVCPVPLRFSQETSDETLIPSACRFLAEATLTSCGYGVKVDEDSVNLNVPKQRIKTGKGSGEMG